MSAFERVLSGVKDVLLLRDDVSRISAEQVELETDVRDHEKRLIRIETYIEFNEKFVARPRLPGD